MKRFLLGIIIGLLLGWMTVPLVRAAFSVNQSDGTARYVDDDDLRASHAYKWYLTQMLAHMISMDETLTKLNTNMQAVKDKLKA